MVAVKCENISKSFDEDKKVLDDVNLELETGKIYALLGRNGAGKTTLMNCLCTKYLPDSGDVYLLGEKAYENEKVLNEICFMSDFIDVFEVKKVNAILKFASTFYEKWDEKLMNRLLDFFEIDVKLMYSALSKGQKTIIGMIIGLCCGCEIVLLDEIYSGMDAVSRKSFYEILMSEQEKNPRTFILSTHLIEEMSGVFTDVVILHKGKVLLQEEMELLHEKAVKCIGRTDKESLLNEKNVIAKKEMGVVAEYDIYDELTVEEQKKLTEEGFVFETLSLQELFIALTDEGSKEWSDIEWK